MADFKPVRNLVITIGTFDGVHQGHTAIFNRMKLEAGHIDGQTLVITFYPHPRIVLGLDNSNLKFINTQEKKVTQIKQAGIDHLVIVEFTKEFATKSSDDFIREVIDHIHPAMIVTGYDHHFGKNREGNYNQLVNYGRQFGFAVEKVEALYHNGIAISSSKIRKLLEEGNVRIANALLGYEYSISGKVVKGKSIGKDIGFPTANIETGDEYKLIAAVGVYACRVEIDGKLYKGMSNIGFRPTIDHGEPTIEVNIFDFSRQIYGHEICIYFVERLRDEVKFASLDDLVRQLHKDKQKSLEIL